MLIVGGGAAVLYVQKLKREKEAGKVSGVPTSTNRLPSYCKCDSVGDGFTSTFISTSC